MIRLTKILKQVHGIEKEIWDYVCSILVNNSMCVIQNKEMLIQTVNNKILNSFKDILNDFQINVSIDTKKNHIYSQLKLDRNNICEEFLLSYMLNIKNTIIQMICCIPYKIGLSKDILIPVNTKLLSRKGDTILQGIDVFYTSIATVKECLLQFNKFIKLDTFDLVIEPSAGSGNFLLNIDHSNIIGLDIQPAHNSIIKQDYLLYQPDKLYKNILIIGNPPFGRICSLAIKFFNHSAVFGNVIAFIIPRSFRKVSIQNKLDLNFKLISDIDIPTTSNTFCPSINIKCCFQIWIRSSDPRIKKELKLKHPHWDFLNYIKKNFIIADFAIRAYGGECGFICESNLDKLNPKGWHFIKSNIDIDELKKNFNLLNYEHSKNTARQNSLGKAELIELYTEYIYNL